MPFTRTMRYRSVFLLLVPFAPSSDAFFVAPTHKRNEFTALFMGKGLNRARNKQADMMKKMQLAKQQNTKENSADGETQQQQQVEQDNQEEYDRLLFAELLAKNPPPADATTKEQVYSQSTRKPSGASFTKPKVKAKTVKKKKRKAQQEQSQESSIEESEDSPLLQGDTAKRRHFESLVDVSTSEPLGAIQAAQLVPWVPPFLSSYLVIVADPRKQSSDLRQAIQYLTSNASPEILSQTIVISADSPQEVNSWMKRARIETPIRTFSDPKLEWMSQYSAVAREERWSMSVYTIDTNGIIQGHTRQVDPSHVSQVVVDMVETIRQ